MRFCAILGLIFIAAAQESTPVDPITDRLRYEIAAAQRDYIAIKQQLEQATTQLRAKFAEAEKLCSDRGQTFTTEKFACTEKK